MATLEQVFSFSNSSDFAVYQKWYALQKRLSTDASLLVSLDEVEQLKFWPRVQDVFEHLLPEAVSVLRTYEQSFKEELAKYEKAVKDLENSNKLFEFYKSVLDSLTKLYLDSLSGMLTEVYREVYGTDSKQVRLVMADFRNKKVIKLNVINHIDGRDYVEDFSNEGGAAMILLGAVVAVYFILTTGSPRILFFDESLSALHNETLARFLRVLKQFVDQLGFTFVIIAHDAFRMKDFVTKAYTVSDGVYHLVPAVELGTFLESTGG